MKAVPFSTTLTKECKETLAKFCLKRGLKINFIIEEMIWDRLEEEMDKEIANNTSYEGLVELKELKKKSGNRSRFPHSSL